VTAIDLTSIGSVRAALDRGATPTDVVRAVVARMDDPRLAHVWISRRSADELLADAAKLERTVDPTSPLFGIPFAVKDNIDVAEMPTTAACPAFAYEAVATAPAVARLLGAGALLVGKTNLDQFATGLVGTRSPYGIVRNVIDDRYIAGGSSSGSAVAVAGGVVPFALGTDTAGSGRVPAAVNGIVGLKPTKGLVETEGVVPACRSFDCVSIFARSIADASLVLAIAAPTPNPPRTATASHALRDAVSQVRRVGVPAAEDLAPCDGATRSAFVGAVAGWRSTGVSISEVDLAPFAAAGRLLYEGAFVAERHDAVGAFVDGHRDDVDPTVGAIIAGASRFSADDRREDDRRLAELVDQTHSAWDGIDVLVVPTVPFVPFVDEVLSVPLAVNAALGVYTTFVNLLDLCAVAVPCGRLENGLPFGVTVIAPAGADALAATSAADLTRP
jgi:allophanate hydrolase